MAGSVVVRKLEKITPPQVLLDGMTLWKWEESDGSPQKLLFKVDSEGYFLSARGEDSSKSSLVWDLTVVSDVRSGKIPKDGKLTEALNSCIGDQSLEECSRTLVYRQDGITKLVFTNLVAETADAAEVFQTAINKLAHHLLDYQLPLLGYMKKHYTRLLLESNGRGQLDLKTVRKLMMVHKTSKDVINEYFVSAKTEVKQMDDGTLYIEVSEFTEEIYMNLIDSLLQNRGPDLDVLKQACKIKPRKQYVDAKEFANFLNTQQRDPRLNDILFPRVTSDQAMTLMDKYGGDTDRLTMKDLLQYLMSDDNMIIDPIQYDQCQDMRKPLNHYFINSSHNTYLNGHQLRSESLTEMYIQVLLTGCRCVELDCWPRSDFEDIIITHGNTLCTKVPFKDVVEAINNYAFVASDYPVILSIENHCNRYPKLISRMAEIFVDVFGDKLLRNPLADFPLEPGVALPSPEKLKGKILIKDKVRAPKGDNSTSTLQRGATLQDVPKQAEVEVSQTKEPEKPQALSPEKTANNNLVPPLKSRPSLFKGEGNGIGGEEEYGETKEKSTVNHVPSSPSAVTTPPVISEKSPPPKEKTPEEKPLNETTKPKENGTEGETGKEEKKKYERGEALSASPLTDLLNYVTAMSFASFEVSENLNNHYIMSSFGEEKGMNLIKTKPKEFVRYNIRQNSRVYPAGGSRMNSSNYMPQIYWNVGCQMVALNFQTSDMPMQVNYAKFEMNGGTGYILKPSVMCMEKGFNPFVQKKIEDTVPARLSIKIISGMFITSKKTDLMVEVEMYGLPADIVRRQFTKKRAPAPNPFWDEDYFVFRRVLLPELALLRLVVFDSDHVFIGQRVLPVNLLRAGFRHVSLRDKHNNPLGMANLFLHIKIEDYVPDEYEDIVAALENPLMFATRALEQLAMGTEATGEDDEFADAEEVDNGPQRPKERHPSVPIIKTSSSPPDKRKESAPPELLTKQTMGISRPRHSAGTTDALGLKTKTLPNSPSFGGDDTMSCLAEAKSREKVTAASHDSPEVVNHPDYLKILKRCDKAMADLTKKHEKAMKSVQTKQAKEMAKASKASKEKEMEETHKDQLSDFERSQQAELQALDRQCKTDLYEKQKFLLGQKHDAQRKEIEKMQKSDLEKVQKEIVQVLKRKKKGNERSNNKDWLRGIEQEVFSMGMQTRSELNNIHNKEIKFFESSLEAAIKLMEEKHAEEMAKVDGQERVTLEL